MIEVLSSFNCTTNTFFVSIDILDNYLTCATRCFETKDIHLIGVTAMLLASKMEEIIPFKVSTVVDKMTHGKMQAKDVVRCEENILKTFNYDLLSSPSLFVFIETLVVKLNFHTTPYFKDIMKVVTYVSKMMMHDYALLTKYPLKYLACSCLYICFKIIEQINRDFKTKAYVEKMKTALCLNEQIFYNASETMLNLAKNFEKLYPFAKNLLKFDSFSLEKESRQ
jgi:cyclin B